MNKTLVSGMLGLMSAVLLAAPTAAMAGGRECTIDCTALVPTVTMAGIETRFSGSATSPCPDVKYFIWDFGDGSPLDNFQWPTYSYPVAGTYTWTLTVNVGGSTCTRQGTIVVTGPVESCAFGGASPPPGLCLVGDASVEGNALRLTPAATGRVGAAWCATRKGLVGGFETAFRFRMTTPPAESGAGGLAFLVGNDNMGTTTVGQDSGGLGYEGTYGLAFEFDSFENPEKSDPNGNHVAIMGLHGGLLRARHDQTSLAETTAVPPLNDGAEHTARIVYEPGLFSVYLDALRSPILTLARPIEELVNFPGDKAWVGFSAATEASSAQTHDILEWSLTPAGPACTLTCSATAPATANLGMPAYFLGFASASNCTADPAYDWDFGDSSSHGSLQNPSHTYSVAGSFTWTLTVTADDRVCTETGTVNVQVQKPGDCDLGGTISIGEVQKAINMFLGVAAVECGADCSADGAVSIGEVQKVINGFLGLSSSC